MPIALLCTNWTFTIAVSLINTEPFFTLCTATMPLPLKLEKNSTESDILLCGVLARAAWRVGARALFLPSLHFAAGMNEYGVSVIAAALVCLL
jgi:hypothetical protein